MFSQQLSRISRERPLSRTDAIGVLRLRPDAPHRAAWFLTCPDLVPVLQLRFRYVMLLSGADGRSSSYHRHTAIREERHIVHVFRLRRWVPCILCLLDPC